MPKVNTQAQAAKQFAETWKGKGYEKGESQTFWNTLLRDVLLVKKPEEWIHYEEQVKMDSTNFIDAYIDRTKVMIEQKSIDKDLSKAYQQALRYRGNLSKSLQPDWIVTCNFKEFRVYDMEHPNEEPQVILLENLENEYYRLEFLVKDNAHIEKQKEVSLQAGDLVGKLYDSILPQYRDKSEQSLHSLNILCVRLVFCFYAEDSGIFEKNQFYDFLNGYEAKDLRDQLLRLFEVLNTEPGNRDPYMRDELKAFPYTNGGLFADKIDVPPFTDKIKKLMLDEASKGFDWSGISPTIFGAVFESTLNLETRRKGGMHYTSIENIHKVIDPLFMDDLHAEFEEIMRTTKPNSDVRRRKLNEFQDKLESLTFFDPACGSGNFLTETFLSLRRLENDVLKAMSAGVRYMFDPVKVSIKQFYGIEINDFAVTVALTALWISEYQMLQETQLLVDKDLNFLPLKSNSNIIKGNSLLISWSDFLPKNLNFIIGNPPFIGHQWRTESQKSDMNYIFGGCGSYGKLDYVCCWFKKAVDFMNKKNSTSCAFVSTSSICEGESSKLLWKPFFDAGIKINFAYQSFVWTQEDNSTKDSAQVKCVIVGFSYQDSSNKVIFKTDKKNSISKTIVSHINGYLKSDQDLFVKSRTKTEDLPAMYKGSQLSGNFYITEDEKNKLEKNHPEIKEGIRKIKGADELIKSTYRYCLFLHGIDAKNYNRISFIKERIDSITEDRKKEESSKGAKDAADSTPAEFEQIRQPSCKYIAIPRVSSGNRKYIPIDIIDSDILCSDALQVVETEDLYIFGVLTSSVHMAWVNIVCGRLRGDYRYNSSIYYEFPWPNVSEDQKNKIRETAGRIIKTRKCHEQSSLRDLYGTPMDPDMIKVHKENDNAVISLFKGLDKNASEQDIIDYLSGIYNSNKKKEKK